MATTAGTIKHRHQSGLPVGTSDVDVPEWNDSEVMAGGTNGDACVRDSTRADGWGWTPLGIYAPLASPAFTGVPTVPTAAPGTNNNQAASTAFVTAAVAAATPVWVPVAYSAANFVGAGGMTWTVDAGDQVRFSYLLNDKTMKVSWWLDSTTLGGTASAEIRITIPAGKTSKAYQTGTFWTIAPSPIVGYVIAPAGANYIQLLRTAPYALGTNNTTITGTFEFEIN